MSELQQLRDRVAELEDALGMTARFPRQLFPLSLSAGRLRAAEPILGLLLSRAIVPAEAAFVVAYGSRHEDDQPSSLKIISVLMHYLRKQLVTHGITIRCQWGQGWYLTADDKVKLRALIAQHEAQQQ